MNSDRLARFRDQFIELSRQHCGDITSADHRARMPAEGDAGTAVSFEKLNTAVLENQESLREDVLNALRRVDEGTYGRCELCGQDIIEERLAVLPFTRFCARCAVDVQTDKSLNQGEREPFSGAHAPAPRDGER